MPRSSDVQSISKEVQTGRVWVCKAGTEGCERNAPCNSCRGRRNRRSGKTKQRTARKLLGIQPPRAGMAAHEEEWNDRFFRDEVKSGIQVKPVATRFLLAETQALGASPIGDGRPVRVTWMPPGWGSEGLVTVRLSAWRSVVLPALEAQL